VKVGVDVADPLLVIGREITPQGVLEGHRRIHGRVGDRCRQGGAAAIDRRLAGIVHQARLVITRRVAGMVQTDDMPQFVGEGILEIDDGARSRIGESNQVTPSKIHRVEYDIGVEEQVALLASALGDELAHHAWRRKAMTFFLS
jgi:hypothetical protein